MARQYPDCPWLNEAKTSHAKLHQCSQCIPDNFSHDLPSLVKAIKISQFQHQEFFRVPISNQQRIPFLFSRKSN